jgi:hypothetical protein
MAFRFFQGGNRYIGDLYFYLLRASLWQVGGPSRLPSFHCLVGLTWLIINRSLLVRCIELLHLQLSIGLLVYYIVVSLFFAGLFYAVPGDTLLNGEDATTDFSRMFYVGLLIIANIPSAFCPHASRM